MKIDKYRTHAGLIQIKYRDQRYRSKKNKIKQVVPPDYTQEELYNWAVNNPEFIKLFKEWADSKYKRNKSPSFDRIDSNKGYTLSNLQVTTWEQNNLNFAKECKNKGYHNVMPKFNKTIPISKTCPVDQLDLEGNFIKSFGSAKEAHIELNIDPSSIIKVCRGKKYAKTAGGFKWRYKQ